MAKLLDYLYIGSEDIPSQTTLVSGCIRILNNKSDSSFCKTMTDSIYTMSCHQLRSLNITHVVNVTCAAHYSPGENMEYLQLNCRDEVDEPIIRKAETSFAIIELARSRYVYRQVTFAFAMASPNCIFIFYVCRGEACLIHCRNGMSRSATVAIAYLMKYQGMSLIQAFKFVRDHRPCVSPNPGFMRQLVDFERSLYGRVTLDVQRYEDDRFGDIKVSELELDGFDIIPLVSIAAYTWHFLCD